MPLRWILLFIFFMTSLSGQTLHFSYTSKPGRLNPLLATDSASSAIAEWIFNGLMKYDENGTLVPDMAQSYHFLSPTRLVFTLRKGMTWSDGTPIDARDVVATYQMALSPKLFTPYSEPFPFVKNVMIRNPYELEVIYKKPYFKALEMWTMSILPSHILSHETDLMTSKFNTQPLGCGPYRLEKLDIAKDIVLTKNRTYFVKEPKIDQIVFHFTPDPATEFLMLKQGSLDMGTLNPIQYERQIDKGFKERYTIVEEASHSYTYLGFNLRLPKFKNPKVRQALSLGINRQEIIDVILFGHGKPCTGPFLPGSFAFDPTVKIPTQDTIQAQALLAQAGYNTNHPLSFEIVTSSSNPTRLLVAQMIQYQLAKIGVKVTIRAMEWQAFLNTVIAPRHFETVLLGWSMGLMPDAYSIWHSDGDKKGGFNFVGYHNHHVDTLINRAEQTVDEKKLGALYRTIFREISQDNPYLFLFIPHTITAINKHIKGVKPSIVGITHNLIDWEKKEP